MTGRLRPSSLFFAPHEPSRHSMTLGGVTVVTPLRSQSTNPTGHVKTENSPCFRSPPFRDSMLGNHYTTVCMCEGWWNYRHSIRLTEVWGLTPIDLQTLPRA